MMSSAAGLVFFLLSVSVVQGQNGWGVTYRSTQICAAEGSTVDIICTYTYPYTFEGKRISVKSTFWFVNMNGDKPVDLKSDVKYKGRVQYSSHGRTYILKIKDVRESDSAVYKFRFTTNHQDGQYTGERGVNLSVTDPNLHVQVNSGYSNWELECRSNCLLPNRPSYVWYQNGLEMQTQTSTYKTYNYDPPKSFSCALRGHEGFPALSVCVGGRSCNRVIYSDRSVCALKGSSVDLSCNYNSHEQVTSKIWFRFRHGYQNSEDLGTDSQYTGRVQVLEAEGGRSTLRITELRETDSGQYRFTFSTQTGFQWRSSLPGTTLTVTDIQLQTYWLNGELKFKCHTVCPVLDVSSYVWYKNGKQLDGETSSFCSISHDHENSYSCAMRGHEDFASHSACVYDQICNRVIYTQRRVCALKGSTVDISCQYNSYDYHYSSIHVSKLWFSPERSGRWQSPSQPEDLCTDSQYTGRVQVLEAEGGRSTLRIIDLRETDSGQYRFTFKTQTGFEWGSSLPGTTLTVTALQVQVTRVITLHQSYTEAELKCLASCSPDSSPSFVWFKNGSTVGIETASYEDRFYPGDTISCAFRGHSFRAPLVYPPQLPSVSLNSSGEIVEGSSVTLTCSSDANPAANYTWYKENQTLLREEPQLVFSSIQSSDSGQFYCIAENELGRMRQSIFVDVKYAPQLPSVSVSPSGEILEGSSVTLTCSSDANPAANYTWFKENQTLPLRSEVIYFTSISSSNRGSYSCKSENQYGQINSLSTVIDVQYSPRRPSVSVSPSGEIVEGSSVTLTCSSDANPAANYTWFKENEESPKASGQIFTITDIRPEHSGKYYCDAENQKGRHSTALHVSVLKGSMKSAAAGSVIAVIAVIIFLSAFLLIRKKRVSKRTSGPGKTPSKITQLNVGSEYDTPSAVVQRKPAEQQEDLFYASISLSKNQEDPLYSNIRAAQPSRHNREGEEDVEYTMVNVKIATTSPKLSCQEAEENSSVLYSTLNTAHRV